MRELTEHNAADYLRDSGRTSGEGSPRIRELSGGVSNVVLRVDQPGQPPFVIKQCRERLRVATEWRARLDRIWMEHAALGLLTDLLPPGAVPRVLFEDRPEYLFAMTCAPDNSTTWKARLMEGEADPRIAGQLGTLLATIHTQARGRKELDGAFADTSLFDELRVDPYYRTAARAHPNLASRIETLIAAMELPKYERTLVLGDFSPKNILVHPGGLILLDFECAHAGDAAFDLGFFLSHLILKSVHARRAGFANPERYLNLSRQFWDAYHERVERSTWHPEGLAGRAIAHTAACLLARVDGKSPVEYLDPEGQDSVRRLAISAMEAQPRTWDDMTALAERNKP